jgi:uncharacterized protein with HEPN domain
MTAARDALMTIRDAAPRTRQAVTHYRRAVAAHGDATAAFGALHASLVAIARAVEALPDGLTSRIPGFPWQELARLPGLVARPDIRVDAKTLEITLDEPLRRLPAVAMRLNTYLSDHPELAAGMDGGGSPAEAASG